jgi:coniferyl-aldehyde dehydrogenase
MRPEKRKTTPALLGFLGAKAEVQFQPKGVVGIISPWNFPVNLTFAPLAGVLAAGNRAMIKPSEFTPATSDLMAKMFAELFDEEEIAVFPGGPEVGQAFSELAFDHLIFTGATSIARHVMKAAAQNLVPITLELGGKSPVILGRSADYATAAARVMAGKTLNAGQICLAPDYVLAPEDKLRQFVSAAVESVETMFPTIKDNPDYTAVIADRHYERIKGYIDDARAKGAEVLEINPGNEDFSQQQHRKIPPTLIINPTDDMKVMQEEIFGPVLPVMTYSTVTEAIAYVNAHERPLGLYYFGADAAEEAHVLAQTTSGGVTVNDVIFHVAQEELPFGGVGPSGMGSYHGVDGFREFSHRKSIYRQLKKDLGPMKMLRPPYGEGVMKFIAGSMKP